MNFNENKLARSGHTQDMNEKGEKRAEREIQIQKQIQKGRERESVCVCVCA